MTRFFTLLAHDPASARFWDIDRQELRVEALRAAMPNLHHQDAHMVRFFAAIWLHEAETFGLDLLETIAVVSPERRRLIAPWCADPFWP